MCFEFEENNITTLASQAKVNDEVIFPIGYRLMLYCYYYLFTNVCINGK